VESFRNATLEATAESNELLRHAITNPILLGAAK
jgi:hypothetical protein